MLMTSGTNLVSKKETEFELQWYEVTFTVC